MDPQPEEIPNTLTAGGWDAKSREILLVGYLLLVFFSKKSSTSTGRKKPTRLNGLLFQHIKFSF